MKKAAEHGGHVWVNHDAAGRSKICDACKLAAVDIADGSDSHWIYCPKDSDPIVPNPGTPEPPCPGYPAPDITIPTIPRRTQ